MRMYLHIYGWERGDEGREGERTFGNEVEPSVDFSRVYAKVPPVIRLENLQEGWEGRKDGKEGRKKGRGNGKEIREE